MMSKITTIFTYVFAVSFFGAYGVKYVLHQDVPDMVLGFLAWGIAAMLMLHARFHSTGTKQDVPVTKAEGQKQPGVS